MQVTKTSKCMDTGTKSPMPLVGRVIHHAFTTRQSNAASDRERLVPHLCPMNMIMHRTPHLLVNRVEVGAVGRSQIGSNERRNLLLQ